MTLWQIVTEDGNWQFAITVDAFRRELLAHWTFGVVCGIVIGWVLSPVLDRLVRRRWPAPAGRE